MELPAGRFQRQRRRESQGKFVAAWPDAPRMPRGSGPAPYLKVNRGHELQTRPDGAGPSAATASAVGVSLPEVDRAGVL